MDLNSRAVFRKLANSNRLSGSSTRLYALRVWTIGRKAPQGKLRLRKLRQRGGQWPPLEESNARDLGLHHVHAAYAAARHVSMLFLLLRRLRHTGLGGDEETSDRGSILQRRSHDLGGIDDALLHEVDIFVRLSVIAEGWRLLVEHLADDD